MPRNTALRFRCQGLLARWVTLTHHWNKVTRQIEEGTYKRDVVRARQRAAERESREQAQRAADAQSRAKAAIAESVRAMLEGADFDDDHEPAKPSSPVTNPKPVMMPMATPPATAAPEMASPAQHPMSPSPARGARPMPPPMPPRPAGAVPPPAPPIPAPAATARPAPPIPAPAAAARPSPPIPAPAAAARPAPPVPAPAAAARPAPPVPAPAPRPAPPAPALAVRPTAAAPAAPAAPSADLKPLFDRYVEARRQNNERTDNVRLESLASSIEKMLPDLQRKHAGKKIDFEVVLKDGRVGLKPVAR